MRTRNPKAFVKTDVSEESIASTIRMAIGPSETTELTRTTRRNIPEDGILHGVRHENLKS
jgi:hypothetical protein